jgi:putative endonuclease
MKNTRQNLGKWGEDLAAVYLSKQGYTLLDRNLRTPYGEIDLVMRQNDTKGETTLVFIEVKTRSSASFGLPEISVDSRKQEHLVNSALAYMQEHPELDCGWRIDVISIQKLKGGKPPRLTHFENAVGDINAS